MKCVLVFFCVNVLLEVLNCRVGAVVVVDESRLMYCTYEKVHHIGQVHISVLFYFVHHDRHFSYLCIRTPSALSLRSLGEKT